MTMTNRRLLPGTILPLLLFASSGLAQEPVGDSALVESLISEMETVFSETRGMIDHTMTVRGHAMEIMAEEGGDPLVVEASAILHDIGIPRAREVHGSSAGPYQEEEGPPIAREILSRYPIPQEKVDHICGIVANHHTAHDPEIVGTIEFQILWDADWLVNFPGRHRGATVAEKETAIGEIFRTKKGEQLARQMFLE
jgi:putative nucleotidyltransferase with HDIG domain